MKEEQIRGIREQLESGVLLENKSPAYFNAVVGDKYVGYVISLHNAKGKQINIVLKVLNNKELFENPIITMTIHSIFRYKSEGGEEQIESSLIGQKVILTPNTRENITNHHYFLTGMLNLKNKPP